MCNGDIQEAKGLRWILVHRRQIQSIAVLNIKSHFCTYYTVFLFSSFNITARIDSKTEFIPYHTSLL